MEEGPCPPQLRVGTEWSTVAAPTRLPPHYTNLKGMLQTGGIIEGLNEDGPQPSVKIFYSLAKFGHVIFEFL